MSLALWLRAGRAQKGLSLEDVAKITKIQPRILERLEAGKLDGLPAEVFVRGFIRSVAKCVGLDESEALVRYSAAQGSPTTIPTATPSAVAFVESMSDLAPSTASVLAPVVLVSNPPTTWAGASNQGLPARSIDELDDVDIDVDVEPVMLAHPPAIEVVEVAKNGEAIASNAIAETAVVPASIEVVDASTVASAPVDAAPVDAAPVDAAPVDAAPVDAAPVDPNGKKKRTRKPRGTAAPKGKRKAMATGTPSGAMPIVAAPSDAMTADAGGVGATSLEVTTLETTSNGAGLVDAKAVDAKAVDAKAVDAKSVDAKAVDAKAVDAKAVDAKADAKAVDANVDAKAVDAAGIGATASIDTASIENASVASTERATGRTAVGHEASAADDLFGASTATMIDSTDLVDGTDDAATASSTIATSDDATATAAASDLDADVVTSGTWKPSMPTVTTSSVPWRRPALGIYATSTAPVIPTLVIDDADPDSAEREQEDRAQAHVPRKSFLPPILAERAKNAASGQGTLTLAVIILLIAATLTLSYLMRRPSSSGDGVTRADGTVELVG